MAKAVDLQSDFSGMELRRLARPTKDSDQARRLLALSHKQGDVLGPPLDTLQSLHKVKLFLDTLPSEIAMVGYDVCSDDDPFDGEQCQQGSDGVECNKPTRLTDLTARKSLLGPRRRNPYGSMSRACACCPRTGRFFRQ